MDRKFADRLRSGEHLLGTLLSLPSPELAEVAAAAGFDWLWLDMEHGLIGPVEVQRMVQAAGERCASVVRIPERAEMWVQKALDSGAAGVIVPHVDSPEQAAMAVRWSKYPPEGGRSVGFSRANMFGRNFQEDLARANIETAVVVQVEHVDAVRNIEGIAAVPGVSAVLIGPFDLSASLNKTGRLDDPEVREAIDRVRNVCAVKEMPLGIYARDIDAAREALDAGYAFVCVGLDAALYASAVMDIVRSLRSSCSVPRII